MSEAPPGADGPGTKHEFWTGGFPAPARSRKGLLFRALAHVYLSGVAGTLALLTAMKRRPEPAEGRRSSLRVLAIGPFFSENWVAAHLEGLAGCDRVERVDVVVPDAYRPIEGLRYLKFSPALARRLGDGWARVLAAIGHVRRERPDVIIGYHLPWNGLMALLLARACGARALYFSVGGPAEFLGGGCYSEHALFTRIGGESPALERRFVRMIGRFDGVLTMGTRSAALFESLSTGVPIVPISVGVSGRKFAQAATPERPAARYDLVTVGRLARIKRVDVLLRAVGELPAGARPSLAVVGDGAEAGALRALTRQLGIEDRVHFLGWRQDVENVLRESRLFVMSSASEGLPLSLIEAMLSGLPAVMPDVGDIPDLVVDGMTGRLFPPGDVDALAAAITDVLEAPGVWPAMAARAREAAQRYTVAARAKGWGQVFERLA